MNAQSSLPTGRIRLSPQFPDPRRTGHPWIYAGHIQDTFGPLQAGDVVDVYTSRKQFCGRGFYNPHSKIRVRLLTDREEAIDEGFVRARLDAAWRLRQRLALGSNAYRLVYGESDFLPGLVVDQYHDVVVMQTLSYGLDRRKDLLADALVETRGLRALYLRNDAKSRALEGLPLERACLRGELTAPVEIFEGQARFLVDVTEGQKTGWFCDQRENRTAAAKLAKDLDVLEVFCHTGAFGVHAALQGARSVEGIDASEGALNLARRHAAMNKVEPCCHYRQADAFDELRILEQLGRRYGMVILDPPAFARSRHAVRHALAGYKDLNLRALRLLAPEGLLVSCSCSQHVPEEEFWNIILAAARDARRTIRLIEQRSQGPDHPVLGGMPETRYLKCFLVQAV
ncbi:class I SAM-dependent rRNA methyltransferase [Nitrospira sp. Nam80]